MTEETVADWSLRIVDMEEPDEKGNIYAVELKWPDEPLSREAPRGWSQFYVYGVIPQRGRTKEEALYWAERAASKNGFDLIKRDDFEGIEPALPDDEDTDEKPEDWGEDER